MKYYLAPLAFIFCISCAEQAAVTTSPARANSSYSGSTSSTNTSQSTSSLSKDNNANTTHNANDNHVRKNTNHEISEIK